MSALPHQTSSTIIRVLRWLALGLTLSWFLHGFITLHLSSMAAWAPVGWSRLAWFSFRYAVVAGTLIAFRPGWLAPSALLLGALFTIGSVGIGALAGTLLLMFSMWTLGERLLNPDRSAFVDDHILAFAVGLGTWIFALGLLVRFRINYPLTYYCLAAVPLLIWRDQLAALCKCLGGAVMAMTRKSRAYQLSLALLIFVVFVNWLVTLKPETSADGLAVHLAAAADVAYQHKWHFDVSRLVWSVMPLGTDWCYAAAYMLGGEYAARLFNFGILLFELAMLFSIIRRWLPDAVNFLLTALFASTPVVYLVTGSLFVENTWAALLCASFLALVRHLETNLPVFFYFSAALLGTSLAVKFGSLAFVIPMLVLFIAARFRKPGMRARWFVAAALFLACASQPYITSYVKTGNPIFPFANAYWKSPFYETGLSFRDGRFVSPPTWHTLYDVTFDSGKFIEGRAGAAGFQFILFMPLTLFVLLRRNCFVPAAALFTALAFALLTFGVSSNLRYLYPSLLMATLPVAYFLAILRAEQRRLYQVSCGVMVCTIALNVCFLPAAGFMHREFFLNPFDHGATDRYLQQSAPVRKLVSYLNLTAPGQAALFISTNEIAEFHGPVYTNTWHTPLFSLRLRDADSILEELKQISEHKIRYFIAPVPEQHAEIFPTVTPQFLDTYTEPVFRYGRFYLAVLRKQYQTPDKVKAPEVPVRRQSGEVVR